MQRQLQGIERKAKDLTNALEQIKAKERYQLRQIQHSQENIKVRTEATAVLAPNQASEMKDVLEKDGKDISDMMKQLNKMKKELL